MDEAVINYQKRRDERVKAREDAFEEGKHKRDKNGRFTSGGGESAKSVEVSVGKTSTKVPTHMYEAVTKAKWKDGEKYGDAEIDVPGVGKALVKTEGKTKDGNVRSGIYIQAQGESKPKRVATVEGRNGAMDDAKRHLLVAASNRKKPAGNSKPRQAGNKPRQSFGASKDWEAAESKDPKVRDAALRRLAWEEDGKKKSR